MELNFKTDIKKWLDNQPVLQPVKTSFCPNLKPNSDKTPQIKAVIFDIYGTLLISSSGDIDQATLNTRHMKTALAESNFVNFNKELPEFLLQKLPEKIKLQQQEIKEKGHPFPDIDIFRVWNEMLFDAQNSKLIKLTGSESVTDAIFIFELLSNPVYPMPGMKEILFELKKKNIPLGIVSNAQFYTPILMNYFLNRTFSKKQYIDLFDADLSVFSYNELRAKPDVALFEKFLPTLKKKYGVNAHETVFVGNDMLKDIYTAKKAHLQTILFAGDERSLRLREDDQRVKGIFPDYIITELSQILNLVK